MTRSSEAITYIVSKQGEQDKEKLSGDYLEALVRTISSAPETTRLLSSILNYDKAENYHLKALLNQLNNLLADSELRQDVVRLIEDNPDLGFMVEKDRLNL